MRVTLAFLLLAARVSAQAPPTDSLTLDVYTADSSAFGVTSTLISGATEAILVDAQFRISDAERLADRIAGTGKRLKAIIITHPHPDHYFGIAVLRRRFPGTPVYITPAGLQEFNRTLAAKIATWGPMYGGDVPTDVPAPMPLPTRRFTVDGHAVEIVGDLQGDALAPTNSYVWVPSLSAAVVGDLAYDHAHVWLAESDTATRAAWQTVLRRLEKTKPRVVVAGHKLAPELPNDAATLAFTIRYIGDFETARARATTADELVATMQQKYPDLGFRNILTFAAQAAFPGALQP
jgi:glyoxylase-like metal-dependent hydrolase (beta-lactamase superfamily II)